MPSFQEYFGIDKRSAAQKADINGNIVAILQVGCLWVMPSTTEIIALTTLIM